MSSKPIESPAITISRQMADVFPQDLSTTPGGTIYATTPGGTRIVYDRNALLFLRNSPLSKTPPHRIATIPGVTVRDTPEVRAKDTKHPEPEPQDTVDENVFEMD